jgi:hypothetical protein
MGVMMAMGSPLGFPAFGLSFLHEFLSPLTGNGFCLLMVHMWPLR